MQRIPIVENVLILKQFHLSHVTVAYPDSSESRRTSVTDPSVNGQSNSIPTKCLLSVPKDVFTSIISWRQRPMRAKIQRLTTIHTLEY